MKDPFFIINNLKKVIQERNRLTKVKNEKNYVQIKMPSLEECTKNLKNFDEKHI